MSTRMSWGENSAIEAFACESDWQINAEWRLSAENSPGLNCRSSRNTNTRFKSLPFDRIENTRMICRAK